MGGGALVHRKNVGMIVGVAAAACVTAITIALGLCWNYRRNNRHSSPRTKSDEGDMAEIEAATVVPIPPTLGDHWNLSGPIVSPS